jgi:ATP-dependent helicase HrpA
VVPLEGATFATVLERAKSDLRGIVPRLLELLREILTLRLELQVIPDAPPSFADDLAALVSPEFLRTTPYARLALFPRYLKAMKLRAERARKNPAKDAERQKQVAAYAGAVRRLPPGEGTEALRWLIEELRVSVFAQELGTAEPVSAVKIERALAALRSGGGPAGGLPAPAPGRAPKPIVAATVSGKKAGPLKSLGALDKLLGR